MTEGRILPKLFSLTLPILAINIIHSVYNMIDSALLGQTVGDDAVAAVGATTAIFSLIYTLVGGLCTGVNVLAARAVGAKNFDRAREVTGTAMLSLILIGLAALAVVYPLAPTILRWTNCDPEVLPLATTYLRIIFLSLPVQWFYRYQSATLRAAGNTTYSMVILLISGASKVIFNFLFLKGMNMGIEGPALATLFSHVIALLLFLVVILRSKDAPYSIQRKNLRIRKNILWDMVRFGIPAGMSGVFFYTASTIIQSAVNSLGKTVMAANSVAMRFDGFVYTVGSAVALAGMSFVGQNVGAKKPDRVVKSIKVAVALSTAMSLSLGVVFLLFSDSLCGLISSNPEVLALAKMRLTFYCLTYFITSIMEILASSLTALGYAKNNVCVGFIVGLCLRAGYVLFLWPSFGTLMSLYAVVPVTSLLACTEYLIALKKLALPKLRRRIAEEEAAKQLQNA